MTIHRFPYLLLAASVLLLSTALPRAFAGSPFYLTVDRSFSNTEKPQVRLDYTSTAKPMLVRVIRPKNLERFLDGQIQISRSYEQPTTELNPGHFFVKGLNGVESPIKEFRDMVDVGFRKSLKDTSLNKAILNASKGELASPPEQIIHGPPAGFSVVREYFVDLEYGGTTVNDLGWWFADSAWSEDRYKIRTVTLDPLPDGVYLVQAVQGATEAQCLMQVSSLSVQVKQSTEQLVVRVIDRAMQPVAGATVRYRDGRGKWIDCGKPTNEFGEVAYSNPEGILEGKLVIKVETTDGRQALVDTDFLPAASNDNSVFIVTDRPIFKPGETFFYKGTVRSFDNGNLTTPDLGGKEAHITLIRSDGTPTDLQAVAPVTRFGSFSGSFDLDPFQTPGLYRLIADIAGKPYGGELRVRDYVKPTFYLELVDRSPTVSPGEKFVVKFRAKRYSGGVPKDAKYEVFLYRKKFEAPQWLVEAGAGLSAGTDYQGEIRSASALLEPRRIFSSIEQRFADTDDSFPANTWDSAPRIDESGEASFEFTVPKAPAEAEGEWIYSLMIRAADRAGSQAVLTENIYMTLSEAQPVARFSKAIAQAGDKDLSVLVRSTYPDGKPAPRGGGVIDIALHQGSEEAKSFVKLPFSTDERGSCELRLPELAGRGKLVAVATLETLDGKPMTRPAQSQPALMIVGGAQGETVVENRELELYTQSTVLSPGDKVKVLALLPAGWGKAEQGVMWETISGYKVYETKSSQFQGRSRWLEVEARPEYGTGFYQTVTVPMGGGKYKEQTLGFRIVPTSKRLNIAVAPEREETEPLKPFRIDFQVTDAQGAPAADTELAVTVVDRAVYAVQSELRPGVFDFFYPLPRLNLATFYSDELQGYGYADVLKKPNFQLGALKSQSRLPKKAMRDTAGWFPHVVTDSGGRASVTVDLPANVTEWLITAIAADKNGRVGESKGRFRTAADLTVEVIAPRFLRQGETATVQLKTTSQKPENVTVRSDISILGDAALQSGSLKEQFSVDKRGEHLLPLTLQATGDKGAATLRVALASDQNVRVGGAEEFDIPLKRAAMRQVIAGVLKGNSLLTELPDTGRVEELKVQVHSGLLGAALNAAAVLVSYPYGCTEQLVHSTIPNLVLMDLVHRAGIAKEQLGPLAAPLTRAEKNAALGIRKIILNQKTDGGFGLWPSDPQPSVPVTLTALYALKFAGDLHVEGAERSFNKGSDWLRKRLEKGEMPQELLSGYALSRLAEINVHPQPWKEQIAFVQAVEKRPDAPVQDVIYALEIFTAHKDNDWDRFGQAFKNTTTRERLVQRLQQALDRFDPKAYMKAASQGSPLSQSLGFGFGAPSVVSAGMGVLAELQALPEPLQLKLERRLLTSMKNGFWVSTFDTAQVIFHTREILSSEAAAAAHEQQAGPRAVVARKGDGSEIGKLTRIPGGFVGTFPNPGTPAELAEIHLDGLGPAEVAYCSMAVDVPYDAVAAQSQGIALERTLLKITPRGIEKLDPAQPLHRGDIVVSEVHVTRSRTQEIPSLPSQFLVIEDGIPSFAEAIDEDETYLADAGIQPKSGTYWAQIKETQRHPERTVRIAKVLPRGELTTYQVWRVAFPGSAAIPPARAFDMYDESLQGNTQPQRVRSE